MSTWTEERLRILKDLWLDGFTCSEIARHLGVTKNAVIGKVHRLGLPSRPSPIRRGGSVRKLTKSSPRLSGKQDKSSCCWIDGDPSGVFTQCSTNALVGKPYCSEHYARAYIKAASKVAA